MAISILEISLLLAVIISFLIVTLLIYSKKFLSFS